jgi:hypothetical protein
VAFLGSERFAPPGACPATAWEYKPFSLLGVILQYEFNSKNTIKKDLTVAA